MEIAQSLPDMKSDDDIALDPVISVLPHGASSRSCIGECLGDHGHPTQMPDGH